MRDLLLLCTSGSLGFDSCCCGRCRHAWCLSLREECSNHQHQHHRNHAATVAAVFADPCSMIPHEQLASGSRTSSSNPSTTSLCANHRSEQHRSIATAFTVSGEEEQREAAPRKAVGFD